MGRFDCQRLDDCLLIAAFYRRIKGRMVGIAAERLEECFSWLARTELLDLKDALLCCVFFL